MAIHYRTVGFFIKKFNRGEADQIFTVYTKDFGRLEILGKAIRKIKSKLRSGAELFYLSEIEFIQGKTRKTLTEAILINNFQNIRKSLRRLTVIHKVSRDLDSLIKGEEPDLKVWGLLKEIFEKLNDEELEAGEIEIARCYFLWNLFAILGYQLDFYHCSLCQKKLIPENLYFEPEKGGIRCKRCPKKTGRMQDNNITLETVKILRLILKKDWQTLLKVKLNLRDIKNLNWVSQIYFKRVLEIVQ